MRGTYNKPEIDGDTIIWEDLAVLFNQLASAFQFAEMRKRFASEEQWESEKEHYEVTLPAEFMKLKAVFVKNKNRFAAAVAEHGRHKDTFNAILKIIEKEAETVLLGDEDGSES